MRLKVFKKMYSNIIYKTKKIKKMEDYYYLYVPFSYKDEVKKLGCHWDSDKKKWYIRDCHSKFHYVTNTFKIDNFKNNILDRVKAKKLYDDEQNKFKKIYEEISHKFFFLVQPGATIDDFNEFIFKKEKEFYSLSENNTLMNLVEEHLKKPFKKNI
jgi:hypothetical protein